MFKLWTLLFFIIRVFSEDVPIGGPNLEFLGDNKHVPAFRTKWDEESIKLREQELYIKFGRHLTIWRGHRLTAESFSPRRKRATCPNVCCPPSIGDNIFQGVATQNEQFSYEKDPTTGCYDLTIFCTGYGNVIIMANTTVDNQALINYVFGDIDTLTTVTAKIPCDQYGWGGTSNDTEVLDNKYTCQVDAEAPITATTQVPFDLDGCVSTSTSTTTTSTTSTSTTSTTSTSTSTTTPSTSTTTTTPSTSTSTTSTSTTTPSTTSTSTSTTSTSTTSTSTSTSSSTSTSTSTTTPTTTTTLPTSTTTTTPSTTPTTTPTTTPKVCCAPGGTWSDWTQTPAQCTDYCGACGNVTMDRTCLSESSGCPCTGPTSYKTQCNTQLCYYPRLSCCPGYSSKVINGTLTCGTTPAAPSPVVSPEPGCPSCCPTNGIWSEWTTVTACNDTCGSCGISQISRQCLSDSYGCPCTGPSTYDQVCGTSTCLSPRATCCPGFSQIANGSTFICGPVDGPPNTIASTTCCPPGGMGLWSPWTDWTTCSATCGLCGTNTRSRVCSSAKVGCPCIGNSSQMQSCGEATCNLTTPCCSGKYKAVGYDGFEFCQDTPASTCTGTWTAWKNTTGATCNDTCGNCGIISQYRYCFPSGCQCSGPFTASNPCANAVCIYPRPSCCLGVKKIVNGKFVCA